MKVAFNYIVAGIYWAAGPAILLFIVLSNYPNIFLD